MHDCFITQTIRFTQNTFDNLSPFSGVITPSLYFTMNLHHLCLWLADLHTFYCSHILNTMALQALVPSSFLQSVSLSFTKVHPNFFYNNQLSCKTNSPSKVLCLAYKNNQENDRPLGNFRPTIWKDGSISSPVLVNLTFNYFTKLNKIMFLLIKWDSLYSPD